MLEYADFVIGVGGFLAGISPTIGKVSSARRKNSHLREFFGRDCARVKIVLSGDLPCLICQQEFMSSQPANVLFTPFSEGAAVARLYLGLNSALQSRLSRAGRGFDIELVPARAFDPDSNTDPFICVGGPSINTVTRKLLPAHLPEFKISYPDHEVFFNDELWHAPRKPSTPIAPGARPDAITEDYGFILSGRIGECPFVILWGVYAFGTLAASRALLNLSNKKAVRPAEKKRFASGEGFFIAVHAPVRGYQVDEPIQAVRPQPQTAYRIHE